MRSFSYSDSGQISEDIRDAANTYDFTFNANDRLQTASLNSSTVGTYSYNALEQRVAKTAASATIQYVYAPTGELLSENDGSGNPIREYIWMGAMPVAVIDLTGMSPVTYYIHADHLGRPQKMTDASAAIVWDAVYDPFGNPYSVSGTATNLLMFPGQIYDSETALSQNWHRDYDPSLGRYIESDPIGLQGGVNTYAYVLGNPDNYFDSDGLTAAGRILGGTIGDWAGGFLGGGAGELADPLGGGLPGAVGGRELGRIVGGIIGDVLSNIIVAMARPPGCWPGDAGAAEWGRRNGVGAREGKARFHGVKQGDKGKGKDDYSVDPKTGDVYGPDGDYVGSLGDEKPK